ncbi:hypothetical protein PT2222_210122 [Paraburkholderia tropica]
MRVLGAVCAGRGRSSDVVGDDKQTAVFLQRVAIGHARDVMRDLTRLRGLVVHLVRGRQQARIVGERVEKSLHDAPRLVRHAHHAIVAIQIAIEKALERGRLRGDAFAVRDERRRGAHLVERARRVLGEIAARLPDQIDDQRIDDAPHGLVNQPPPVDLRILGARGLVVGLPEFDFGELLDRQETGTQPVVDVVIVVGDFVGDIRDLRLDGRLASEQEALAQFAQTPRVLARAMLENALARLETEIEAVERAVVLLQFVDDRETLQVVLEAAVLAHALVERVLTRMAERRMTEVVRKRNRLDEILVHAQLPRDRTRDLRDFEAVRQPRAEQIAFVIHEDLGLVFEPAKRRGMDDAVAVALEFAARGGRRFGVTAAARLRGVCRVRGKPRVGRGAQRVGERRARIAAGVAQRFLRKDRDACAGRHVNRVARRVAGKAATAARAARGDALSARRWRPAWPARLRRARGRYAFRRSA